MSRGILAFIFMNEAAKATWEPHLETSELETLGDDWII